nr:hypothetical protein [Actinomadura macra]
MTSPANRSRDPAPTGTDIRSPRTATAMPVATSGSARLSVPAVAALTRRRPATKAVYAAAVAAIPSQATSAAVRGAASLGVSASIHGSSAVPPARSVTETAAVMPTSCRVRTLADTV